MSEAEKTTIEQPVLTEIGSSYYVNTDTIETMMRGEAGLFRYAGMQPDFYAIQNGDESGRSFAVDCLYSEGDDSYLGSYIIRMPSSLGKKLAAWRGKPARAHVSSDIRPVSQDIAFSFAHACMDEVVDREMMN
jgi:hypothetical protein